MPSSAVAKPAPLGTNEVAARMGVTPKTLMSWVKAGKFPAPLPVGIRKYLWPAEQIEELLRGKAPR
jgi:excisionase family DNA binding protein